MRMMQSKHPENAGCNHAVTRRFNKAAVCATALERKTSQDEQPQNPVMLSGVGANANDAVETSREC